MSSGVPKVSVALLLAGVVLAALSPAGAQQPARRRSPQIEFTEPGTTTAGRTNTAESAPKKSSAKLPENAIRKPLDFFDLDDSFSGVPAPGNRTRLTVPQSKREREQMERKKNWVFNTPEEALGVATPEDTIEVPEFEANGEAKKAKSSLERYLQRMEKARTEASTNQVKGDSLAERQKPDGAENRDFARKEDKAEDGSIFALGRANASDAPRDAGFAGVFGGTASGAERSFKDYFNAVSGDSNAKLAAPSAAQSQRMDAFRQLLESRSPASPGLGAGYDPDAARKAAGASPQSPFSSVLSGRDSLSPQGGPRPSSLPSLAPTTSLPNLSPSYSPSFNSQPAWSAPRTVTPAPPTFELPQRKF